MHSNFDGTASFETASSEIVLLFDLGLNIYCKYLTSRCNRYNGPVFSNQVLIAFGIFTEMFLCHKPFRFLSSRFIQKEMDENMDGQEVY